MLYMLAVIKSGKDTAGIRLLDTSLIKGGNACKDVACESIKTALKGKVAVENLGIRDGKLVGTNGVLDRYASITPNNEIIEKSPLVVLFRTDDGFIVSDYLGNVSKVNYAEALKFNSSLGIANAKKVNRDGKEVISSINGEYPYVESTKVSKKVEVKFITVSDKESVEDLMKKIKHHIDHPEMKLVGKLSNAVSDRLIMHVVNHFKVTDLIASKETEKAASAIKDIASNYMPVMSKVCDKKAVIANVKGLKAVYAGVSKGDTDVIDRAIRNMEEDKVKFGTV